MGYYRLLLAFLVVASHVGVSLGRYNLGEIAVVSFFLLSGYVMTALIDGHYRDLRLTGAFYLDRALRLYPQFLVYSFAAIVTVNGLGLRHPWMTCLPTARNVLAQLTMLPLNFVERFPNMLLPQAWSLGLEWMFCAIFPFVLIPGKRLLAASVSALVFALAFCGKLNADWFAYRLLPGVLFVFMLGSWVRRPEAKFGRGPIALGFALAVVGLALALTISPQRSSVCDVLIGLVFGLPVVYILARLRLAGRWDTLAGDLSYGVFLNHNLLLPIVQRLLPDGSKGLLFLALVPASTALSYATFCWIESPAIGLRRNLRASATGGGADQRARAHAAPLQLPAPVET